MLLEIRGLIVKVGGRTVLNGVTLSMSDGEVHVLLGPNGAGKSTLLKAIIGFPGVSVDGGELFFDGKNLMGLPPYERAKLGIAVMFQNPPKLRGVKLREVLREVERRFGVLDKRYLELLEVSDLLNRSLHEGFSGGETKRAELLLLLAQRPRLALLDEPDSGVDVDNLRRISDAIRALPTNSSILIVTHTGAVLKHLPRVDVAHVMLDGRIVCSGDPDSVLKKVLDEGFSAGVVKGGC